MKLRVESLVVTALILAGCSSSSGVKSDQASQASTGKTTTPTSEATETTVGSSETTAPSGSTVPDGPAAASIEWDTCDDPEATDEALQCATLTVPIDYTQPDGETIDLALVRVPAVSDREGAVLFNPGGPGASGFDPIAQSGVFIRDTLGLENFDLIGFDPRGVQRSNGIRCQTDDVVDKYLYLDGTPDTAEEQALFDEQDGAFTKACQQKYGDTLKFYSTANTARDMDAIRAGLGDEQLSYLGISYGTYLGAAYASLFPDRVRAMVLDSAYEPNGDTVEQQYETQLVGFEGAFNNWAADCQADSTCAFNAPNVGARWDALKAKLDAEPIAGTDGRLANNAVLDTATTASLYSDSEWPVLSAALAKAETGDPAGLFALADSYNGREKDGTFNTLFQSYSVIQCASGIDDQQPDDPQALVDTLKAAAPRFGADISVDDFSDSGTYCDDLTNGGELVELKSGAKGPIVVVGGTNDPATPIRWATEMTAELGANARMVTYTGEGHGQLLVSTCVTDIEASVLRDLTLPDAGTTCAPDPTIDQPTWWSTIPVPADISDPIELAAVMAALGITDTTFYSESRTTTLDYEAAAAAYDTALTGAGFESLGSQDLGIESTTNNAYMIDGDLLLVVTLGPAAFDSDDLIDTKESVPPGQSVVLLLFLANP